MLNQGAQKATMQTEVVIRHIGQLGEGVGEDGQGNVYFVPGTLPGDRARVSYPATSKRYREAQLEELLEPSPDRREPVCSRFGVCGGCDWLNWDYAAQVRAKDQMLRHLISRTGFEPETVSPFVGAVSILGYRGRIQLRREGGKLGLVRRRSHDIVDIESCPVAHPRLNEAIAKLRQEPVTAERHKIELAVQADGTVGRWDDAPHGAGGFTQIHTEQNESLRRLVSDKVREAQARRVVELYCGNGNLTFAYAPHVETVFGFDASGPAIEAARAARSSEDERRLAFVQAPVDAALVRKMPPDVRGHYDTLVLDPPRTGIGPSLERFLHPNLKNIIYIACSPVSFSKDIQCLRDTFRMVDVQGIDMFPHTRHIELVARFSRVS